MAGKRLSRVERRAQLLDTAAAIVRAEGTEALTLARVADDAGVTKPIVYGHFETRVGLLKALYQRIDDHQTQAASHAALEANTGSLREAVVILAAAYVDCVLHIGKEFGAITAALSTSPEFEDLLLAGRDRYAEVYLKVLRRHVPLAARAGKTIMVGVIGAAEALAREVTADRLGRRAAVTALSRIIQGAVCRESCG